MENSLQLRIEYCVLGWNIHVGTFCNSVCSCINIYYTNYYYDTKLTPAMILELSSDLSTLLWINKLMSKQRFKYSINSREKFRMITKWLMLV